MHDNQRTVALLQDLQGVLTEIQPYLTDGVRVNLQPAAAVRRIRQSAGELLADLTNPETIVQGYRNDAIDCMVGVTRMMITFDDPSDGDLRRALVGMEMAASRIRHYLQMAQAKETPCAAG